MLSVAKNEYLINLIESSLASYTSLDRYTIY